MKTTRPQKKGLEDVYSYRVDEPDEELKDNPMALVFPPPQTDAEIFDFLLVEPEPRPENFARLPLEVRIERIDRSDECYYPFPWDIAIVREMQSLSRKTFRFRHPKNPLVMSYILNIGGGVAADLPRLQLTGGGDGLGMVISGSSGGGKSSLMDRACDYFGEHGRRHFSVMGRPCVWPQLGVVRISAQDTWKATLVALLREIDIQHGRDMLFTRERYATEPRLKMVVSSALSRGFAPLVIIDEFQRIKKLRTDNRDRILQNLVNLMSSSGIPLVVIGTEAVRTLLDKNPMDMSKIFPGERYSFQRVREGGPGTWEFISMLKQYAASIGEIQYADDFDKYLVLHAMGVRRIMRHFLRWVFKRHAYAEAQGVNIPANKHLLQSIAENEMKAYAPALSALRKHDLGFGLREDEMQAYEDFIPDEPEKEQTSAQKMTEALWRAESQRARAQEFRLLGVEEFVHQRAQVALNQYELEASWKKPAEESQAPAPAESAHAQKPEPGKAKGRKDSSIVRKREAKARSRVAEISNVVPLSSVRPPQAPPSRGVDPGDLPD